MPEADMYWVDVNDARFRVEHKRSAASTIVFLHEMGGSLESYDGLLSELGGRWDTLRYDQRGAGFSDAVAGSLSIDTPAADLGVLLDALSITTPVVVVGAAVGAAVAIRFATRCPERAKALVLLAPSTGLIPERRAITLEKIARLEASAAAGQQSRAAPPESGGRPRDPASYAATWRMLINLDLEADLAAIRCPTLVIAGLRDADRPPAHVAEVAAKIPGARLIALDTGHVMAIESPDLVANAIGAFLDSVDFR